MACPECTGNLTPAVLHAVTQTDRVDLAVIDGGPRVHRHRIGIVQHLGAGFADLANVLAEIQKRRNELLSKPIRYGSRNGTLLTVLISQLPKLFGEAILVTRNVRAIDSPRPMTRPNSERAAEAVIRLKGSFDLSKGWGPPLARMQFLARLDRRDQAPKK